MSTLLADKIAQFIRLIDGNNAMEPADLGYRLAGDQTLSRFNILGADMAAFVARTNPDKQLGAGRLGELIVAEFNLPEVA